MAHRSNPYPKASTKNMRLWFDSCSEVHPLKEDQVNADAFIQSSRFIGAFHGVGDVAKQGLLPRAMSTDLAIRIDNEVQRRLSGNAQRYDRDTQAFLRSSVPHSMPGGWLRNVAAKAFATTDALGSAMLGIGHISGEKLDYCFLGDIKVYIFRPCPTATAKLVETLSGKRRFTHDYSQGISHQCYLPAKSWQSFAHVEDVFASAVHATFKPLMNGDTIVLASGGITDNLGDAEITRLVCKAYEEGQTPGDLAKDLTGQAIAHAYSPDCKPDDATCIVSYVYHEK